MSKECTAGCSAPVPWKVLLLYGRTICGGIVKVVSEKFRISGSTSADIPITAETRMIFNGTNCRLLSTGLTESSCQTIPARRQPYLNSFAHPNESVLPKQKIIRYSRYASNLPWMLMYGKEASNRKQEIDRQHYTIPNQRPKDKHCGKI